VPAQQSPVAVQTPLTGWHSAGGTQTPLVQIDEQHWLDAVHAAVFALQTLPPSELPPSWPLKPPSPLPPPSGKMQMPAAQTPLQQEALLAHELPSAVQVGVWQRRKPPSAGRHGAPLQHWSLN
jgi:hypothetical protein